MQVNQLLKNKNKEPFNIGYRYYGTLFVEDLQNTVTFLYIIHRNGIIKFNVNRNKIEERFKSPNLIPCDFYTLGGNQCCLNQVTGSIYLNDQARRTIIEFNTLTKIWNYHFYHYGQEHMMVQLYGMQFLSYPKGIVQFMSLQYRTDFVGVRSTKQLRSDHMITKVIDQQNNINIVEERTIQDYTKEEKKWRLKYLKSILGDVWINDDIRKLYCYLFESEHETDAIRNYNDVVSINIAWKQILFFISTVYRPLEDQFGFKYTYVVDYIVDCVDLFDPRHVHVDLLTLPMHKAEIDRPTLYVTSTGILHYIHISGSKHYEIKMIDYLPRSYTFLYKSKRKDIIYKVIKHIATTVKSKRIPKVLLQLIFDFCPKFT